LVDVLSSDSSAFFLLTNELIELFTITKECFTNALARFVLDQGINLNEGWHVFFSDRPLVLFALVKDEILHDNCKVVLCHINLALIFHLLRPC